MIDNSTKEQIRLHLIKFCEIAGSDNKASAKLDVSNAYVSQIKNNKWGALSDDMWRKISKRLGLDFAEQWAYAETLQSKTLLEMFEDSRTCHNVYGIIMQPGSGKTYMLDRYRLNNSDVFYVKCVSEMSPKEFFQEILRSMGKTEFMGSVLTLIRQLENEIERREKPIVIIDEPEKLPNKVLNVFIDLYNTIHRKAGIIMLGTPNLKERVKLNRQRGKVGYNEIYSRLGLNWTVIPSPGPKDASKVLQANGITDQLTITKIINESTDDLHGGVDLRRVDRLVHKEKLLAVPAGAKAMAGEERRVA